MKRATYEKMQNTIKESAGLRSLIIFLDWLLTKVVYVCYPLLLIILFIKKEPGLLPALLVPAVSFILVSIFRHIYNAPRPYEIFDIRPVINRKGGGKSFPSRHVFSVFIIAVTAMQFYLAWGIALLIIGAAIAAVRVVGGVHFPRDVFAGALIAAVLGAAGFYLFSLSSISIF